MRIRFATGALTGRSSWRRLRRRPFVGLFAILALLTLVRLLADPTPLDVLITLLVVLAGAAAVTDRAEVAAFEGSRRTEAESFARILRGLSRSVSPDAIVAAIVEELGAGTGADHVAVVRRRPETRSLEAILSPTRAGAPTSRTTLPLSDLDDPADEASLVAAAVAAGRGRRMTAIPIETDEVGEANVVPLGVAADRLGARAASLAIVDRAVAVAPAPAARTSAGAPEATPDGRGRGAPVPVMAHRGQASPAREGADQRIADRIAARLGESYGLGNLLAAPLRIDGKVEGAIVLSRRTRAPWPAATRRILAAAAVEASAALARVYSLRDAEARATTDALTGLPNRRYFDEYAALLSRRRRADDRVGVLMIDIDRFKKLNDTFGHAVGDHVLRDVAQVIGSAVREGDVPARFGGEEFAVLLRNPTPEVAVEVGERVRRAVHDLDLRKLGVPSVSVSVGVAVETGPDQPIQELIDDADRALYRAKRAGRNRVVAA